MSDTDLAFIAAYQRSQSDAAPTADGQLHGPHFESAATRRRPQRSSKRAPLSSLIKQSQDQDPIAAIEPALELDSLAWPPIVERLATQERDRLGALLTAATDQGAGVATLVSARPVQVPVW